MTVRQINPELGNDAQLQRLVGLVDKLLATFSEVQVDLINLRARVEALRDEQVPVYPLKLNFVNRVTVLCHQVETLTRKLGPLFDSHDVPRSLLHEGRWADPGLDPSRPVEAIFALHDNDVAVLLVDKSFSTGFEKFCGSVGVNDRVVFFEVFLEHKSVQYLVWFTHNVAFKFPPALHVPKNALSTFKAGPISIREAKLTIRLQVTVDVSFFHASERLTFDFVGSLS